MSEVGTRVDISVCTVRGRPIKSDHSNGILSGMMTLRGTKPMRAAGSLPSESLASASSRGTRKP